MNLFADYLQPLTEWLQANPNWSLFITFIVSLAESLAIIGSIIPGSVTMTAIGILAGAGIIRLDLTLLAASLGAICGDSLSYALGYFYSEQLAEMWPFSKYPKWLLYGKEFFSRHGGKSVLFGRFVGPLRSLIPVIAGIMHMKQWRFLLSNVISAIAWSLLYVMPGALIGAASHGLSAESATRLFILILTILAGFWILSIVIKWIFIKLNVYLNRSLNSLWLRFKTNSKLSKFYNAVTPIDETNHYPTAALSLLILICLIFLIIFTILSFNSQIINFVNIPIHLFMQSFHTRLLAAIFIVFTQLTSSITIFCLYLMCCFWFIQHKHLKAILYLSSIIFSSILIGIFVGNVINRSNIQDFFVFIPKSTLSSLNLEIATAFYGFILLYINNKYSLLTNTLKSFILIALGLSGFGSIYLGDVWFTDVIVSYFGGLTICLIHYLIYRKNNLNRLKTVQSTTVLCSFLLSIIGSMSLATYLNFNTLAEAHKPHRIEHTVTESVWWNQQNPILPLYRLNRIGNKISLLNIQYAGDLDILKNYLENTGWETHKESFFTKLLMKMNPKANDIKFPLLAQLYENKPPELIMTHKDNDSKIILELNIWESNYNIIEIQKPLWIGTIHQNIHVKSKQNSNETPHIINSISYIIPALNSFTLRRIDLPKHRIHPTLFPTTPTILLIK
jgi:membrane protein DedA with SNARE-associated domain